MLRGAALWAVLAVPVLAGLPEGAAAAAVQLAGLGVLAVVLAAIRWPLPALVAAFALLLAGGNFVFALPVVSYRMGRYSPGTRSVVWAYTLICVGGVLVNTAQGTPVTVWFPLTVWLVLLGVLPWLAGRAWRQYIELVRAGWQRAEQLEREQQIIAERERLRERSRIAQDMHDGLGHELGLIALRAGALELAADLEERHRAAAAELRVSAAVATERLAEIIGMLREDAEPAPLEPAGGDIAALVERAASSGMAVVLHDGGLEDGFEDGTQGCAGDASSGQQGRAAPMTGMRVDMAERAAYRVVQEALTNAAKHAPGAAVSVRLARSPGHTVVSVTNAAPPDGAPPVRTGGGLGLTGLRERVRLAGGTLRTGPTAGDGFQVSARLPRLAACTARPDVPVGTGVGERSGGTASQLARRRRLLRRDLILLAALAAVMAGYYVHATVNSVLPPAAFAGLTVGQTRAEIADVLPARQWWGGSPSTGPPAPPGSTCEHYRPDANPLGVGQVYRLCFAGGRLVAKDVFAAAVSGDAAANS
ncbi:Signal transduction histidine kinase [Thermomonospora echinospora]|uniref:histidine kinase n=1 Tax=Thermomonospora echinospora TaxID=1992 RepID=A0A1H6DHJ5_9ACTN|nr:Signal transduction histidine kinase [Thermomonospora echinospora]